MRPELEVAVLAVRAAQARLSGRAGRERVLSKGGRDVVTDADLDAEDAIRAVLLERFPDYPIVGEERGGQPPAGGKPHWLVDPLCGTRLFASGLPVYCSNIALVEDGQVTAAAIGDGTSADVYLAERGNGAWIRRGAETESLGVSDASQTLWVDPISAHAGPWTAHGAALLRLAILSDRWHLWMLGTTLCYPLLAKGSVSGVVMFAIDDYSVHSAAGCLLAIEAGAAVTDFEGAPWSLTSHSFVGAAHPALHEEILKLIDAAREPGME